MGDSELQIRCQRCGTQMDLVDPAAGQPWPPQQYWSCAACGRHFWTTYPTAPGTTPARPTPPAAARPAVPPAAPPESAAVPPVQAPSA